MLERIRKWFAKMIKKELKVFFRNKLKNYSNYF